MWWKRMVLIGAAGVLLALPASASTSSDDVILAWRDGPVRYLMTAQEDRTVRAMHSVPELARFISEFWARRDPSPGTLENEFRSVYWSRVLEADRLYRDSTIPGWRTDRGKVYILLGPPDSVVTNENPSFTTKASLAATSGGEAEEVVDRDQIGITRGVEQWTYTRRTAPATASEYRVAFVRDASLDWKLSSDPALIQPTFPGSSTTELTDPRFGGISDTLVARNGSTFQPRYINQPRTTEQIALLFPPIDTSTFANYDLGLELTVPQNPELMIGTVTTSAFLPAFSATPRFEFFRARDGSTFVSMGALVTSTELYPPGTAGRSTLRLYASVMPVGRSAPARLTSNEAEPRRIEPAKGPPPGGVYDTWTGLALEPGRYHATLAIEDSLTGQIGRAQAEIDVPDFSGPGLALSSLVIASELSDTGDRLGVTARSSGTFLSSESLGLYYEVYGLPGGDVRFTASYRFFREMPNGALTPVGKPVLLEDRANGAQGWSLPLAQWPAGRYRVEVTVTGRDNVSASRQVSFEVAE